MSGSSNPTRIGIGLLVLCMAAAGFFRDRATLVRDQGAPPADILYLQSSTTLRRLSLGYSSLLADIYWTRAVQYFGGKHMVSSNDYALLYPLLDIATDLDPHLIPAYDAGSMLLSSAPPAGAGEPDKAAALVEKGIRENPERWRLYFTLGFIHYIDRHDYRSAQQAFEKGSQIPGALPWMKVMAATMAERAGEPTTAYALWSRLAESTQDQYIQENARKHLAAIQSDQEVIVLEQRVTAYEKLTGRFPVRWQDMIRAGLLRGIPVDPTGRPYLLTPKGTVEVTNLAELPFATRGIPGHPRTQ